MAPEQIDGREVDTRADVFAFGAVLFEMLTGMKAFDGETPARVMSAILRDEPARVSSIVPVTPAALEALIHACLAKDPHERWQNVSDVARQLRHLREMMSGSRSGSLTASAVIPAATIPRPPKLAKLGWIAAALLAAAVTALVVDRLREEPLATNRLRLHALLLPPQGVHLTDTLALSPDGQRLAFVGAESNTGQRRLWLRPLESSHPQMLAGSEDASEPFWSPDGQHIAFFANGRLKRVPAAGGTVITVCETGVAAGGTWGRDDVIIFGKLEGPLMRVGASGGRPEPLTSFDRALEETHHLYPTFLPDGQHYVFYVNSRERGLYVGQLGSDTRTRLFDPDPALPAGAVATPGVYAAGRLLYVRDRALTSRRFDLNSLTVSGEPTTVAQTVDYDPPGRAAFTIANDVLVYRARQHRPVATLAWIDRAGRDLGAVATPPGSFRTLTLSPDGRTIAIDRRDAQGLPSVWLVDAGRGTSTRLTAAYWAGDPLWSQDGRTLAYSIAADSPPNIVIRGEGGQGAERRLTQHGAEQHYATSFTPDGRQLVFQAVSTTTGIDLYLVSTIETNAPPQRLLQTRANESNGRVSPDGRWLAYVSDDSGRPELYVSRFPELQGKIAVSSGGARRAVWRADGKELFYLGEDGALMSVAIGVSSEALDVGKPTTLVRGGFYEGAYAPDAAGQRFLIARRSESTETVPLEIVANPFQ
jgi:Tol biopolymer transport system component